MFGANPHEDTIVIIIKPETDVEAFLVRQLEYATPTFNLTAGGELEGSLRITRE